MKIIVIHSIYQPHYRGGAEVVVANIVSGLKSAGHEAVVISVGYENKTEEIGGLKVYRIKPFNLFNFLDINNQPVWKRLIWHIIDVFNDVQTWRIHGILRKEKPDLVLTHNLKGLGYEIPLLIKILGLRHIHTIHDMQLIHPSGLLGEEEQLGWPAKLYCLICCLLVGSPQTVIFPSEYIKNIYSRFGFFKKSRLMVLGNPLPLEVKPKIIKTEPGTVLTLAFVGQIEEYKGIIDLVKAVSSLPGEWQLLVAGEGSALMEATKWSLNNSQIKFLGRLDQAGLEQKIWAEADLLINPSRTPESFGMVVIEAMSRGVPVLASKIGALPELVKDDETGWLLVPGDQYDLKHRLEFILANRDKLSPFKNNCVQAAEKFTLDNYLAKLLE
jgi:glycosyltransferase involved in cell wall biosynthesis